MSVRVKLQAHQFSGWLKRATRHGLSEMQASLTDASTAKLSYDLI